MGRAKRASARQKRANEGVDTHVVRGAPSRIGDLLAGEREQRPTREQGAVHVHHGKVEAEGRLVQERFAARHERVRRQQPAGEVRQRRVRHGDALRDAGRARGEEDVRRGVRIGRRRVEATDRLGEAPEAGAERIEPDRGDAPSRELARERRRRVLRQHRIFGADGSEHARDPPRRQRRVDRNVRPAEPERGEKAQQDGRLLLPVDEDR